MPRPQILFVHNSLSSFVRIDRDLLAEQYSLCEWFQSNRTVNPFVFYEKIKKCDLVFGWFASWHTFFPVHLAPMLRKPSLLVVGGYDSANLPEIGYGSMRGGVRRRVAQWTMRNATALVTNSQFTRTEVIQNAGVDAACVTAIYHGLAPVEYSNRRKEKLVITIGNVDQGNLERKGLMTFVRAAAHLPNIPFVVIGAWLDDATTELQRIATPNVQFTGRIEDTALHDFLARAVVYVQASRHEGFGLAVAEAMLAKCIPVVTRAGALPEVVGDAGIYAKSNEPLDIAAAISEALYADHTVGERARERILQEFPLSKRRSALFQIVDSLIA